jgi:hypothetical protein
MIWERARQFNGERNFLFTSGRNREKNPYFGFPPNRTFLQEFLRMRVWLAAVVLYAPGGLAIGTFAITLIALHAISGRPELGGGVVPEEARLKPGPTGGGLLLWGDIENLCVEWV